MATSTAIEITGKIVELLSAVQSEERLRIIHAALTLLGETPSKPLNPDENRNDEVGAFHPRVRIWMQQNGISSEQILQIFHLSEGTATLIASSPGKDAKERSLNAYVLAGLARLLLSGDPTFDDKTAREFCKSSGCYDQNNHSTYLKAKGNEFTGTKEKGWTLTAPGLKRAATMVQTLAPHS